MINSSFWLPALRAVVTTLPTSLKVVTIPLFTIPILLYYSSAALSAQEFMDEEKRKESKLSRLNGLQQGSLLSRCYKIFFVVHPKLTSI